jgi:hypothetical protein
VNAVKTENQGDMDTKDFVFEAMLEKDVSGGQAEAAAARHVCAALLHKWQVVSSPSITSSMWLTLRRTP